LGGFGEITVPAKKGKEKATTKRSMRRAKGGTECGKFLGHPGKNKRWGGREEKKSGIHTGMWQKYAKTEHKRRNQYKERGGTEKKDQPNRKKYQSFSAE